MPKITLPTLITDKFLELAQRGKNEAWRYMVSWLLIIGGFTAANIVAVALILLPPLLRSGQPLDLASLDPFALLVASLLPFVVLFALVAAVATLIHRRPFLTLITPAQRFSWQRFLQGAGLWGVLIALTSLAEALFYPGRYRLDFQPLPFFKFLPLVVLLIPLQTSAEELLFRAYLPQSLRVLTRKVWIPLAISNTLFMVLHFANPEVASGPILLAAYYLSIGLFLAWITLRDNRMELALGVHLATNLFVSLLVSAENSALQTPALFTVNEIDPVYNLISFLAAACLFYWIIFKFMPGKKPLLINNITKNRLREN